MEGRLVLSCKSYFKQDKTHHNLKNYIGMARLYFVARSFVSLYPNFPFYIFSISDIDYFTIERLTFGGHFIKVILAKKEDVHLSSNVKVSTQ